MKEPTEKESRKILGLFRPKLSRRAIYDESLADKTARANREGVSEIDYSFIKIILIIVVVSACAFLFGYSLSAWGVFPALLTGILFASITALLPLFLKATSLHFTVGFLSSIAITVPLYSFGGASLIPVVIFATISAAILIEGIIYSKQELDNSLKLSFAKFTRRAVAKAFIVVALAAAIFYGSRFKAENLSSDWFINGMISLSSPIIGYYIPGFTSEMKFSEFLEILAQRTLTEKDAANFVLISEDDKREIINQTVYNSRRAIENSLAVNVNLDASFEENFRKIITEKLTEPAKAMNPDHVSVIAAATIFIFVRGILWLLGWLAIIFAFFIFQLLLVTKFAEVYLESRKREMVVLK